MEEPSILDAQAEVEKISSQIRSKNGQKKEKKAKKAKKHENWMERKRKRRRIKTFFTNLSSKINNFRLNWLNLSSLSVVFTNILSIFTVVMMCCAVYFSVRHLQIGNNPWMVVSGAILIIVIAFINREIGIAQESDEKKVGE